jgi:hypothetical protein
VRRGQFLGNRAPDDERRRAARGSDRRAAVRASKAARHDVGARGFLHEPRRGVGPRALAGRAPARIRAAFGDSFGAIGRRHRAVLDGRGTRSRPARESRPGIRGFARTHFDLPPDVAPRSLGLAHQEIATARDIGGAQRAGPVCGRAGRTRFGARVAGTGHERVARRCIHTAARRARAAACAAAAAHAAAPAAARAGVPRIPSAGGCAAVGRVGSCFRITDPRLTIGRCVPSAELSVAAAACTAENRRHHRRPKQAHRVTRCPPIPRPRWADHRFCTPAITASR